MVGTVAAVPPATPKPPAASVGCGGGAAPGFDQSQLGNAATIIAVGRNLGVPARAQVVAVTVAMQEASLRNLPGGDRDSAGLFQQRPSQGWGSYGQVTTPTYAAATFYRRLLAIPGWAALPVTVAGQSVQRSAYPDAYAKWERAAAALVSGTTCTPKMRS